MFSIYKIILFFLLFCFCAHTKAGVVGLFDPYFILLFHPKMIDFDFGMQRFLKNRPDGIDEVQWLSERKKAMDEYQRNRELHKIAQVKAMRRFYEEIINLRHSGTSGKQLEEATAAIHKKHLGLIGDELVNLQKFYEDDAACLEIYRTMFLEVVRSINQVKQKLGLIFLSPTIKSKIPVGLKTFSHSFQFDLSGTNQYWKIFPIFERRKDTLSKQELSLMLEDYISNAQEYPNLLDPLLAHPLIITGYEDRTVTVLQNLYTMLNQKTTHAEILGELYELWKKSDI